MRQLSSILLPSAFCKDGTWDGLKDWFFHWFSTIKHWRSQVWWLNLPGRNSGYGFQMRQWDHAKIHTGSGPDHPISISGISIWRNWDTIWFVSIPSLSLWVWTTWKTVTLSEVKWDQLETRNLIGWRNFHSSWDFQGDSWVQKQSNKWETIFCPFIQTCLAACKLFRDSFQPEYSIFSVFQDSLRDLMNIYSQSHVWIKLLCSDNKKQIRTSFDAVLRRNSFISPINTELC